MVKTERKLSNKGFNRLSVRGDGPAWQVVSESPSHVTILSRDGVEYTYDLGGNKPEVAEDVGYYFSSGDYGKGFRLLKAYPFTKRGELSRRTGQTSNLVDLSEFLLNTRGYQFSYSDSWKKVFSEIGVQAMRELSELLGLQEHHIKFNPGGSAVSGDLYFIGMWSEGNGIFVFINHQAHRPSYGDFMYRSVTHMDDWTGGPNKWLKYEVLANPQELEDAMLRLRKGPQITPLEKFGQINYFNIGDRVRLVYPDYDLIDFQDEEGIVENVTGDAVEVFFDIIGERLLVYADELVLSGSTEVGDYYKDLDMLVEEPVILFSELIDSYNHVLGLVKTDAEREFLRTLKVKNATDFKYDEQNHILEGPRHSTYGFTPNVIKLLIETFPEQGKETIAEQSMEGYAQIPSATGNEGEFLDILAKEFGVAGYTIDRQADCLVLRSGSQWIFSAHVDRVSESGISAKGDFLVGKLDNVVSVGILKQLVDEGYRPNIIFTTQEEIVQSQSQLIRNVRPDEKLIVLDIDVSEQWKEIQEGGIALRDKDDYGVFDGGLVKSLRDTADKNNIPFITKDGDWLVFELGATIKQSKGKVNGAAITIPLYNYHSNGEVVSYQAFSNTISLLRYLLDSEKRMGRILSRRTGQTNFNIGDRVVVVEDKEIIRDSKFIGQNGKISDIIMHPQFPTQFNISVKLDMDGNHYRFSETELRLDTPEITPLTKFGQTKFQVGNKATIVNTDVIYHDLGEEALGDLGITKEDWVHKFQKHYVPTQSGEVMAVADRGSTQLVHVKLESGTNIAIRSDGLKLLTKQDLVTAKKRLSNRKSNLSDMSWQQYEGTSVGNSGTEEHAPQDYSAHWTPPATVDNMHRNFRYECDTCRQVYSEQTVVGDDKKWSEMRTSYPCPRCGGRLWPQSKGDMEQRYSQREKLSNDDWERKAKYVISELEKQGFTDGVDVNPAISLLEYGILRNPATTKVIYATPPTDVAEDYDKEIKFGITGIGLTEVKEALEEASDSFYTFIGMDRTDYIANLSFEVTYLSDAIRSLNMYSGVFDTDIEYHLNLDGLAQRFGITLDSWDEDKGIKIEPLEIFGQVSPKFKVGDRVRILNADPDPFFGGYEKYLREKLVGKTGKIREMRGIADISRCRVVIDDHWVIRGYWFNEDQLELETPEIVPLEQFGRLSNRRGQTQPVAPQPAQPPAQPPVQKLGTLPLPEDFEAEEPEEIPEPIPKYLSKFQGISWAGRNLHLIRVDYDRLDGTRRTMVMEPYSYRTRRPKRLEGGIENYFFAYDQNDAVIKGMIRNRVKKVTVLPETFSARWDIEV